MSVDLELSGTDKGILIGMKGDATIEVSSEGAALTILRIARCAGNGSDDRLTQNVTPTPV